MADEVVERYTALADQFGARVEATPDDAWGRPSPCEGWTAKDVVAHVVGGQLGMVKGLTGDEVAADVDADPKAAWRTAYAAFTTAISEPGALDKPVPGPMGDMPAGTMVGRFLANDVLVHTWDLARAVGGDEALDAEAVGHAHQGLLPMDAMLRRPGIFGPKVDAADDADDQERFLNFLGRVTRP